MTKTNKLFKNSEQFDPISQQFLFDNVERFILVGSNEYRLYLPNLLDLDPKNSNCINLNLQRYRACLVILFGNINSSQLIVLDQFDTELYNESGTETSWITKLMEHILSIER